MRETVNSGLQSVFPREMWILLLTAVIGKISLSEYFLIFCPFRISATLGPKQPTQTLQLGPASQQRLEDRHRIFQPAVLWPLRASLSFHFSFHYIHNMNIVQQIVAGGKKNRHYEFDMWYFLMDAKSTWLCSSAWGRCLPSPTTCPYLCGSHTTWKCKLHSLPPKAHILSCQHNNVEKTKTH